MKSKNFIVIFAIITVTVIMCFSFVSCGNDDVTVDENKKLSVVATIFPEYDWLRQILGDNTKNAELTLLLDSGADLHNYQPTADDIVKIANCDMFVYVGGHSDEWVSDVLAQAKNENMVVVSLLEVLGDAVKQEEEIEGMEHGEEDKKENGEEAHNTDEYDEHVWLSLINAQVICKELAAKLSVLDPENAEAYTENANNYCYKLTELHNKYKDAVEKANIKTLLFADRFPFRYLLDDYGLEYYAAFSGCSAESEASFETVAFLAEKVDELGLSSIIKLEGSDSTLPETIIATSKAKYIRILTMSSMQNITKSATGETYLSIMTSNLEILKEALK